MKEVILIKNGELALKGLNRRTFEDMLMANIRRRLASLGKFTCTPAQSTIIVEGPEDADLDEATERLLKVFGIAGLSRAAAVEKDMDVILNTCVEYTAPLLNAASTFKVEAKRADKKFPLNSPAICREVGGKILSKFHHLKVDVHNPDVIINVEVRDKCAFIHGNQLKGAGGMPSGSAGKAALLVSGGIDSPVAGYMIAKRGATLEGIHFFSHPFTSELAKQKVLDLARELKGFTGSLRVHIVPFTQPQLQMREKCPAEHLTLIMRRMMMMIASEIAKKQGALCLVTGESLGQVASQTMEALAVTDDAASLPCFRPVIGMDKEDIVAIARDIGTFETSILPYEDCCTIFVPKHPTTRPKLEKILASEALLDVETLVRDAVEGTEVVDV